MARALLTLGHGTASREKLLELLDRAGVEELVDVCACPNSAPPSTRCPTDVARLTGDGLLVYDGSGSCPPAT